MYNCSSFVYSVSFPVSPQGGVDVTPIGLVYDEGANVTFTCSSLGGPGNTIQWLKDGQVLQNETGCTLLLTNITAARDGGIYKCAAFNQAGSSDANISLNIAPILVGHPTDIHTEIGTAITFFCHATAYPEPQYEWVKVGGALPESATVQQFSLHIPSVSVDDQGQYYCQATSNNITVSSSTATLTGKLKYLCDNLAITLLISFSHLIFSNSYDS